MLESSPDGVNWTVVTNMTSIPMATSGVRYWSADFSTVPSTRVSKPHIGWPVQGDSGRTWTVMPNTPVKVAPGATLRADISANEAAGKPVLNSVTVASTGGGTIDGFAFAASGTLNVEGLPSHLGESVFIPLSFANATDLGNVAGWTLQASGAEVRRRELRVASNGITIVPQGLSIIFW